MGRSAGNGLGGLFAHLPGTLKAVQLTAGTACLYHSIGNKGKGLLSLQFRVFWGYWFLSRDERSSRIAAASSLTIPLKLPSYRLTGNYKPDHAGPRQVPVPANRSGPTILV